MRTFSGLMLVAFLVIAFFSVSQISTVNAATYTVTITIIDAVTKNPIANAYVQLGNGLPSQFTGENGQAVFVNYPSGEYTVFYEERQYHIPNGGDPSVGMPYTTSLLVTSDTELTLELQPLPKLTVTITDAISHNPIADAQVILAHGSKLCYSATTNCNGQVFIDGSWGPYGGCYPVRYLVDVYALPLETRYLDYHGSFEMPSFDTDLAIELHPLPFNAVPEVPLGTITALIGMVAALLSILVYSKFRRSKSLFHSWRQISYN